MGVHMVAKKVVQFRMTNASAKRVLAQIAEDSGKVVFTSHAIQRMKQRHITRTQVLNCLRRGLITEAPIRDVHGNWTLRIERYACGENIGCAVAIEDGLERSIVITAFWVTP